MFHFLLAEADAFAQVGFDVAILAFGFLFGCVQEVFAGGEERGDGFLRPDGLVVGITGGPRNVEVIVAQAIVFHKFVFIDVEAG